MGYQHHLRESQEMKLVELNGMNAGLRPALPTAGGLPSVVGWNRHASLRSGDGSVHFSGGGRAAPPEPPTEVASSIQVRLRVRNDPSRTSSVLMVELTRIELATS